jgi:hypothetical protein
MNSHSRPILVATAIACVAFVGIATSHWLGERPSSLPATPSGEATGDAVGANAPRSASAGTRLATQAPDVERGSQIREPDDTPARSIDIVARFDNLLDAARRGDVAAARRLHDSLANCLNASHAEPDVDAVESTDGERARSAARWFDANCSSYTSHHYSKLLEATELGAEAGDNYLRGAYYALDPLLNGKTDHRRFERYRDNARRFLSELVAANEPDGYWLMSDAHAAGRIVPRDETLAYAYFLAWQKAGPVDRQFHPAQPPYYRNLTADQIRQGEVLSNTIHPSGESH